MYVYTEREREIYIYINRQGETGRELVTWFVGEFARLLLCYLVISFVNFSCSCI